MFFSFFRLICWISGLKKRVGRIRKKNSVKRGKTSGKVEKALEEWWRSFTIGGEVRISLFNFRQLQHDLVNNSHNPEVGAYEKHWHLFSFVFSCDSKASMCCLIFSHLLQTYLPLTSIFLDLPKFKKDCIVPSKFWKIQIYLLAWKNKQSNYCFT